MRDDGGWRRHSRRYLYESPWFHVRQDEVTLPSGNDIIYTSVEHGGYVVIVPVLGDGQVIMERIFRYPLGRILLECPSGGLDGEDPITAAKRELEEETGYRAGRVESLGHFFGSSGISNERYEICLARDLSEDGTLAREETEQMEIELHSLASLRSQALRGEITDGPSALGILLAAEKLGL